MKTIVKSKCADSGISFESMPIGQVFEYTQKWLSQPTPMIGTKVSDNSWLVASAAAQASRLVTGEFANRTIHRLFTIMELS